MIRSLGDSKSRGLAGLFVLHRGELLRFLSARCGNRDEAEDLIQELWIKAESAASGPIANGRAYLFRMANNLFLDRRRAHQRTMARDRMWLREGPGDEGDLTSRPLAGGFARKRISVHAAPVAPSVIGRFVEAHNRKAEDWPTMT